MDLKIYFRELELDCLIKKGANNIAIYGAGLETEYFLYKIDSTKRKYIRFIIDDNPFKEGNHIKNIPIIHLGNNLQILTKENIDGILISIFKNRNQFLNRFLELKKIIPNTIFFNSSVFLISTLPHSGSAYIVDHLTRNLNFYRIIAAGGLFLDNFLVTNFVNNPIQFFPNSTNGYLIQEHLFPNEENFIIIENTLKKIVVHFRDPRQSLLSMVRHFEDEFLTEGLFPLLKAPKDYLKWKLEKKIDFVIDKFANKFNDWIEGWIEQFETKKFDFDMLITNHEILKINPEKFFKSVLNFYGIHINNFKIEKPIIGKLHFRGGLSKEWETVFNERQKKKVNRIFSEKILDYVYSDKILTTKG